MQATACSVLGLSLNDFDNATLRQIDNLWRGWTKHNEQTERTAWIRTRWAAQWIISFTPGLKPGTMTKLSRKMRFAWEKETEKKEFKGNAATIFEKWETGEYKFEDVK